MKTEFIEAYEGLMANSYDRLDRSHKLKLQAIKYCEKHMFKNEKKRDSKGLVDIRKESFHFTAVDLREIDNPEIPLGGSSFEASGTFTDSENSVSDQTGNDEVSKSAGPKADFES